MPSGEDSIPHDHKVLARAWGNGRQQPIFPFVYYIFVGTVQSLHPKALPISHLQGRRAGSRPGDLQARKHLTASHCKSNRKHGVCALQLQARVCPKASPHIRMPAPSVLLDRPRSSHHPPSLPLSCPCSTPLTGFRSNPGGPPCKKAP